jgi:DNA-3-methyladenine glycosylase II
MRRGDAHRALAEADPAMAALVERFGRLEIADRRAGAAKPDAFGTLVRIVVGQQVSSQAARTIHGRLVEAFGGPPAPADVVGAVETLRGAGLSGRKASYVEGLGRMIVNGELDLAALEALPDEEVIERLVEVRGLGRWSGEMFLISHLERPDILSAGDLGIRRGVQIAMALEELPAGDEVLEIGERWRPHRTLASLYLWRSVGDAPQD